MNAGPKGDEGWQEAVGRSRLHFQRAAGEAVAGLRALLDAAALGASGAPAERHEGLAVIARGLDELARALAPEGDDPSLVVLEALLEALDDEIARWERRSAEDPDARTVLRTFLSVREVLWELGLRRASSDAPRRPPEAARAPHGRRVQRVEVES